MLIAIVECRWRWGRAGANFSDSRFFEDDLGFSRVLVGLVGILLRFFGGFPRCLGILKILGDSFGIFRHFTRLLGNLGDS